MAAVLCVLSVILFTLSCREASTGPISSVKGAFTVVTTPVRYVGSVVSAPFSGLANVFSNLTADEKTLSELKEENEKLTAENAKLKEADETATRLQDLLNLQSTYSLESTAAHVISGSTDTWTSTVKAGDLVVTSGLGGVFPKGLPLGKVTNVERTSGSMYYTITVKAFSSTGSFEEVLVITALKQDQKATADDAAAANKQDTSASTTAEVSDAATAAEADGDSQEG